MDIYHDMMEQSFLERSRRLKVFYSINHEKRPNLGFFFLCKNEKATYDAKPLWEKLLIHFITYSVCLNGMIKIFMIRI